jgi:glutamine amidotransferase
VVIASEPMDDLPGWRLLDPGELLCVDGVAETSLFPFEPLRHPLRRSDLSVREAASQASAAAPATVVTGNAIPSVVPVSRAVDVPASSASAPDAPGETVAAVTEGAPDGELAAVPPL